ncbi:hypothetical protein G7068_06605 [Leucobacter viscericola]|uniref:Uncharacterized protein n=1 Tax=Leucobacter viscericola TaxID=2714935 RepID=A0A6G7XEB5_9MICO|nr:hypothetical protein [Leucobacter viscericola]QIK62905.1 hypothetical protein G7068_06605 [Leucobacter viscericola]
MTTKPIPTSSGSYATLTGTTITAGSKVITKQGCVVIEDGHIGLLRENGDLIDSAPVSDLVVKAGFLYSMTSILLLTLNGKKYRVMLVWEKLINAGFGDEQAKEAQFAENKRFATVVQSLGGQVKGVK